MFFLITGAWTDAKKHIHEIEAHGHHVLFMQQEKDDLPCDPSVIEAVICNGLFLYHDINQFKRLRYIQLTSAGYDRVPMDIIKTRNIEIHNARGVYSVPMAEHAIMGILELLRKSFVYQNYQKNREWRKERNLIELNGKEVLIIGCGSVGTECAKRLYAFGTRIKGINRSPKQSEYFDEISSMDDLDAYIKTADIIILAIQLSEETENLINQDRLSMVKDTAILVNISRGRVIDEKALIKALKDHKIRGAFLDVFEDEPLSTDSPLWDCENAILTPHVSFIGDGNSGRLWQVILENIKDV